MFSIRSSVFLAALCGAVPVFSLCHLPNSTLVYSLYVKGHHVGEITRVTHFHNHKYSVDVNTHASFLFFSDHIEEKSSGAVLAAGLRPAMYSLKDSHKGLLASVHFDWRDASATSVFKGVAVKLPIHAPIYDNVSYQLPLRCALAGGMHTHNYSVLFQNKKVKYETHVINAHAKIDTPLGSMDTIEVKERSLAQPAEVNILWFAPKYHYALVESVALANGKRQALATVKKIS
jgi:hypothetical protein